MKKINITLGTREFEIPQFTIRKLSELASILEDREGHFSGLPGLIDRERAILKIGLQYADPTLSDDNVDAIASDAVELTLGSAAIIQLAGFSPVSTQEEAPAQNT